MWKIMQNDITAILPRAEEHAKAGRFDEALACYNQFITPAKAAVALALSNMTTLYMRGGHLNHARRAAEAWAFLDESSMDARMALAATLERKGELSQALAAVNEALAINPGERSAHHFRLFLLSRILDPLQSRAEHEAWAEKYANPLGQFRARPRYRHSRLRIGYVSGDMRSHSTSHILMPLLENHSKAVEIYCYSNSILVDDTTRRLKGAAEHWLNISGMTEAELATQIRSDEIDVLVDLSGHTSGNRLLCFAMQPATCLLTWYGYQHTTGMSCFDGRLTDQHLDPPEHRRHYTEPLRYLPVQYCWAPFQEVPLQPDTGKAPTLVSAVNYSRVTDRTVRLWKDILLRLPDARLILFAHGCSDTSFAQEILMRFEPFGEQIRLTERTAPGAFLSILGTADLALDPVPYGGGITTLQAAWMGVPTLCMAGDRAWGRGSVGPMTSVRMSCIAYRDIEYIIGSCTVEFSASRLAIRHRLQRSPYMAYTAWVRAVEAQMTAAWRDCCSKLEHH